jgi:thioredoxin-related protein
MKKALLSTIVLVVSVAVSQAAGIRWSKSLSIALAEAKSSHKLVMIDFYTDWCGWCKKLDADTYPNPQVVKLSDQIVSVKVNAEKEGVEAAKKYGVTGFPTVIFADGDGNLVHKVVGYLPAPEFAAQMKLGITASHLPELIAKAKANPGDTTTLGTLVAVYGARGDETNLLGSLSRLRKADPSNGTGQLAPALNATGDFYQNGNKLTEAIPYFQEAAKVSKDPHVTAYALISEATCYMSNQDPKSAVPVLHKLIALGSAAGEYASTAKQMLTAATAGKP